MSLDVDFIRFAPIVIHQLNEAISPKVIINHQLLTIIANSQ